MNEDQLEKIERYLSNEMPPGERKEFELQLAEDKELNDFIKLYTGIDTTMMTKPTSPRENELKQTLHQMGKKYFTGEPKLRRMNYKRWMAAAAAILVTAIGVFYFILQGKPSAEKLYARFAVHEPLSIQLRGNSTDSLAASAAVKFNNKDYAGALPMFTRYLQQRPDDIQVKFAQAVCNLETGQYNDAELFFSTIASGQTAYAATAQWYLALLALKQNDIPKCRDILKGIAPSSPFFAKAKELLKDL